MAVNTRKTYRNEVLYSIFVRQYSEEGTFQKVTEDLDRIQRVGADIIWLMPIHPIGNEKRNGLLGSPYAISDYRTVNPEFGTIEDFRCLVDAIHERGMKCIIDVVYNHTSPDSWLAANHPEWFSRTTEGECENKVAAWQDIVDLDYSHKELWDYQIDTLKYWAEIVDGFRCDVAPLLPLEFWLKARREVEKIRPGCIWLSESVEPEFTLANRERGQISLSDSEIFQAFDISYEYDIYGYFIDCLTGKISLREYLTKINEQEYIYPDNYVKLRFLENHDRHRARFIIPDERELRNWTAFLYFQKGMTLIYAGQEMGNVSRPNLFNKDNVIWDKEKDSSVFMKTLYDIKKREIFSNSSYKTYDGGNEIILAVHKSGMEQMIGIFSTKGRQGAVKVVVPDGKYKNLIDGTNVIVEGGLTFTEGEPIVFEAECRG